MLGDLVGGGVCVDLVASGPPARLCDNQPPDISFEEGIIELENAPTDESLIIDVVAETVPAPYQQPAYVAAELSPGQTLTKVVLMPSDQIPTPTATSQAPVAATETPAGSAETPVGPTETPAGSTDPTVTTVEPTETPTPTPAPTTAPVSGTIRVYFRNVDRDAEPNELPGGCAELRGNLAPPMVLTACDNSEGNPNAAADATQVADTDGRDGIILFTNLPFDTYLVRVTTAPAGFDRPDSQPFQLTAADPNGGVSFRLSPTGAPPTAEPTAETTAEPTDVTATEETTGQPTEETTDQPTAEVPTEEPSEEPTTEAPTEEPTEEPTAEATTEPTEETPGGPAAVAIPKPDAVWVIAAPIAPPDCEPDAEECVVENSRLDLQEISDGIWSQRLTPLPAGDYTYYVVVQLASGELELGQGGLPRPEAPDFQLTVPEGTAGIFASYNRLNGAIAAVPFTNQIDAQIDSASSFPLDPAADGTFTAMLNVGPGDHSIQLIVDGVPVGQTYGINGDPAGWVYVVAQRDSESGEWIPTGDPVQPVTLTVQAIDEAGAALPGACFALFDPDNRLVAQECDVSDGDDGSTTIQFPNGVPDGTYRLARSQPGSGEFSDGQEITFPREESEPIVVTVEAG